MVSVSRILMLILAASVASIGATQQDEGLAAANAAFRRGVASYRAGDFPAAVRHFEEALEASPEDVPTKLNLAQALRETGESTRALALLDDIDSDVKDRALYTFVRGQALHDAGRLDEAEASLREAVSLRPAAARTHYQLGDVLAARGRPLEAIAAIEAASRRQPRWVQPPRRIGELRLGLGDPTGAVTSFERALELAPEAPLVLAGAGDAYAAAGRFDEAANAYRRALAVRSNMPKIRARMARALLATGDVSGALEAYERAVEDAPRDTEIRLARALALVSNGEEDAGHGELERVLDEEPGRGVALYYLGAKALEDGRVELARERLEAALASFSRSPREGAPLVRVGRGGEEYPMALVARVRLAESLMEGGELDEARHHLDEVLAAEPQYTTALYLLGMVERQRGDSEAAMELLELFKKVNDAREHDQLALAALDAGDEARARLELEAALGILPDDYVAHWQLARLSLAAGNDEEAHGHLASAIDARPRFEKAYEEWMRLLCRQGKREEAGAMRTRAAANEVSIPAMCVAP